MDEPRADFQRSQARGPRLNRRTALRGMAGASLAARFGSAAAAPADPLATFDHIVVLMLENRSFDNLLGYLYEPGAVPRGQAFEGVAGKRLSNPIPTGADGSERGSVPVAPGTTPDSPNPNPGEGYPEVNAQLYGAFEPASNGNPQSTGAAAPYNLPTPLPALAPMSGFVADYIANYVRETGKAPAYDEYRVIMDCFPPSVLPATTGLAKAFAVCDHWHCAAPTQTFCNRSFFHAASSSGAVQNEPYAFWLKENTAETIFDRIDAAKNPALTWKIYYDEQDVSSVTALLHYPRLSDRVRTNVLTMQHFLDDARTGRLPSYSFIEPRMLVNHNDMHPPIKIGGKTQPSSTLAGDALVNLVYDTIRTANSPTGSNALNTLLVITFDEHGGCYDHVPPPTAVPPVRSAPAGQMDFRFDRFGVRVPAILVSAYIEPGTVVSTQLDHCSILKTIEKKWGLRHLTERDRAANDIGAAINRTTPRPAAEWPAFTAAVPVGAANLDRPLNKQQRDLLGLAMVVSGEIEPGRENPTLSDALRWMEKALPK